jgi:hypothetical protein
MTVHLLTTPLGFVVVLFAGVGAFDLASVAGGWLAGRLFIDFRRGRICRRWDRPGARVGMPDGRRAVIRHRVTGWGQPVMLIVRPFDLVAQQDGELEWVAAADLAQVAA